MRLARVVAIRLAQMVPVALVVVVLNFTLIHLAPGDISNLLAGDDPDPAYRASVRASYGLDQPFVVQIWRYMRQVLAGDLGRSFHSHQPVLQEVLQRLPATLLLVGTSLLLAVTIGTAIGTWIARRAGGPLDQIVSTISVSLFSVPVFWLGLMLILVFAVWHRWLPTSGMQTPGGPREGWPMMLDVARHLVLPAASLAVVWLGQYVRLARTAVSDVLGEGYITTVRAVGFPERRVLLHYALRNALLPVITVFGLQLGLLLAGAVLTETLFSWPGLGRLIYESILARDTPVIMGAFGTDVVQRGGGVAADRPYLCRT